MALVNALTTVALAKQRMNIAVADTSKDSLLEGIINDASAMICSKLKRPLHRQTITGEVHASIRSRNLYLDYRPIQSITSVVLAGNTLASGVDSGYYLSSADQRAGRLYRPSGWYGSFYQRDYMGDDDEGARDITVAYVSGYYLPADVGYVEGAFASLPNTYKMACTQIVRAMFLQQQNQDLRAEEIQVILSNYGIVGGSL